MPDREVTAEEFAELSKQVSTENLRRYRETQVGILPFNPDHRDDILSMIEFVNREIERRERNASLDRLLGD